MSEDERALDGAVRVYLGMDGGRAAMREID
jgi:hypothetical protein